jgi:hypothetical protein
MDCVSTHSAFKERSVRTSSQRTKMPINLSQDSGFNYFQASISHLLLLMIRLTEEGSVYSKIT